VGRLKNLAGNVNKFGQRKLTVWQSLPPYILLAIIWFVTSDTNQHQEEDIQQILTYLEFDFKQDSYETNLLLRQVCLIAVEDPADCPPEPKPPKPPEGLIIND
jgi:hypothetical protein